MYFKTLRNPHKLRVFRLWQKRGIDPTRGALQVIRRQMRIAKHHLVAGPIP
jgi:hypothetical protein